MQNNEPTLTSSQVLEKLNIVFLPELSDKDLKRIKKKLKESRKEIVNGRKKNFFLTEYVPLNKVVEFSMLQNEYFNVKMIEERKRANDYLFDESNLLKCRFYSEEYEHTVRNDVTASLSSNPQLVLEFEDYKKSEVLASDIDKEKAKFPDTFILGDFLSKKTDKFRAKQLKREVLKIMPNQTVELQDEWTSQAYPSIQEELWDLEVEESLVSIISA